MTESVSPISGGIDGMRSWFARMLTLFAALVILAGAPLSAAGGAPRASANPPARIAFWIWASGGERGQIVTARADGRGGVRRLVPGMHNYSFCQSADGRKMDYLSDREAPNEEFVYFANSDGTQSKKITEEQVTIWCHFSKRWLLLTRAQPWGGAMAIVRHDVRSGAEKTIGSVTDRLSLSTDGSKLVFVGGLDFTPVPGQLRPSGKETLELLDLATLARRRLAGPLARSRSYRFGGWSRDGSRFAYTVGPSLYPQRPGPVPKRPPAQPYAVYIQPVSGGATRLVLRLSGGPPSISWSADGRRLLVCVENRGLAFDYEDLGCNGGSDRLGDAILSPRFLGRLLLVDLAHRSVRHVASGKLLFAQWAPSGTTYAYATRTAAYVSRPGGAQRLLARAPNPTWPGGEWIGWSGNRRYIGLGNASNRLAVLDAVTGQIRVLLQEPHSGPIIVSPVWWR